MNLWLRLFWMLLTRFRRPSVGLMDTAVLPMRVWFNDLDFNGHVNNGRYLTMADIGRMDFVLRTGVAPVALKYRALPIVGDALAKFRRDLKPLQRFELHSRLLGWDDKWVFLEHRFVRAGRVIGVVAIRGLFKGPRGPIPPQILARELNVDPTSPPLPAWARNWNDSCHGLSEVLRREESPSSGAARP